MAATAQGAGQIPARAPLATAGRGSLAPVFHSPDSHIRRANGAVKGLAANYPEPEATDGDGPGAFGCDSRATFETGAATWILLGVVAVLLFVGWLFGV